MWATLEVARKDRHMRVIMLVEGIVVSVFVLSELSVVGIPGEKDRQQTTSINSFTFW